MRIVSSETSIVLPETPTEHKTISCSACDHFARPVHVRTVYFYKEKFPGANADAVATLKKSLSKLLVTYYPHAGRVSRKIPGGHELFLDCNDAGVEFIEAVADGPLEELGDLSKPNPLFDQILVPQPDASRAIHENPVLYVQVTRFTCGGFCFGAAIHHTLSDGIAAHNFFISWTEVARGLEISVLPNFDHSLLNAAGTPKPEKQPEMLKLRPKGPPAPMPTRKTKEGLFTFTPEMLKKLKVEALGDGLLGSFTTFESLSAHTWRAVLRAKKLKSTEVARFFTTLDARKRLKPNLPEGYYGNAIIFTHEEAKVEEVLTKPLGFSANLVRQAVAKITNETMREIIAWAEAQDSGVMVAINTMGSDVSSAGWFRLPFYETDFGFGNPVFAGPADNPYNGCILMLPAPQPMAINVSIALWEDDMERLEADKQFFVGN
eukprot:TRINITY_DN26591_c0_g1_i1.p1 TRINITY_DN26591_c0_g1~~TRINITY_DN26591_c0_g1_i1.p1  ORF type:complete len:434 (+),score=75.63 TRINITY_DN26591_c0_g1_i1:362-1663(+)